MFYRINYIDFNIYEINIYIHKKFCKVLIAMQCNSIKFI